MNKSTTTKKTIQCKIYNVFLRNSVRYLCNQRAHMRRFINSASNINDALRILEYLLDKDMNTFIVRVEWCWKVKTWCCAM